MNRDKILGCLLGGAVGDAMGAATEVRTRKQIKEYFGGYVRGFFTPPEDTFAHGCKKGQITDDFSIAYMNCVEIVERNGEISEEAARSALLKWFQIPEFSRFAGPTTKAAVFKLMGREWSDESAEKFVPAVNNGRGTNGAAMKAAPTALFGGGDVDRTIADAVTLCKVSHNNNVSLSGACAVAAATAAALHGDATLEGIIEAGIYGADEGDRIGRACADTICGPSITKRIKKAVELGMLAKDMEEALALIGDYIGSGLMAAEAVPAVFGLIAASRGDLLEAVYAGVNIGDDTDTVATMIGGIMGTYRGCSGFPSGYLEIIRENNHIDIEGLAAKMEDLIERRK